MDAEHRGPLRRAERNAGDHAQRIKDREGDGAIDRCRRDLGRDLRARGHGGEPLQFDLPGLAFGGDVDAEAEQRRPHHGEDAEGGERMRRCVSTGWPERKGEQRIECRRQCDRR